MTFSVLNDVKSNDVNEEHQKNIFSIVVTIPGLTSLKIIDNKLSFLLIPYLLYSIYEHISYFFLLISNLHFPLLLATNFSLNILTLFSFLLIL